MPYPKLVICGSIAVDRIMNFSGRYAEMIHPKKLHVLSLSILLDDLVDTYGGVGANIAFNYAQLGEKPILYGSVGPDASNYIKKLSDVGINVDHIHQSKLPTATFNVITDVDHNQVGGFYSGAMSDSKSLSLKLWSGKDVFISISAHDPKTMASQVKEANKNNMRMLYDPGQQVSNVSKEDLIAGFQAAEILMLNDYEYGVFCNRTNLSDNGIKTKTKIVVTTLGKYGSVIEGSSIKIPIKIGVAKPNKAVDPSGAGDAYRAGFLYGYLRQWELLKCGQLGAVLASFVLEQHGTQVVYSKAAILDRYKKTFNREIEL